MMLCVTVRDGESPVPKLFRKALLPILTLVLVQPATALIPAALANASPASTSKTKKHKKHKPSKEVVLKGHHGKHSKKPA